MDERNKATRRPPRRRSAPRTEAVAREASPAPPPVSAPTAGKRVTELEARVKELEARLARSEREHAGDAELIGRLYAEVADREATVAALKRAIAAADVVYAEAIIEAEVAHDRHRAAHDEASRLRLELEQERAAREDDARILELARAQILELRAEVASAGRVAPRPTRSQEMNAVLLRRREQSIGYARSEMTWLCEAMQATLDSVRTATANTRRRLEDTGTIIDKLVAPALGDGAKPMQRGLAAMVKNADSIEELVVGVEGAIGRVSRVIDEAKGVAVDEVVDAQTFELARALGEQIGELRERLGLLVGRDGDGDRARKPPPRAPRRPSLKTRL